MAVRLLTDSASDLPENLLSEYGIEVVPLMVYSDDGEYQDGVSIKPLDLLREMRVGKVYKTAQVPPVTFKQKFEEYANVGDSCIYIAFSSGLSSTYQAAVMAKNEVLEVYPDFQVDIVDTRCASTGQGLVVFQAARMKKAGFSQEEIVDAVRFHAKHMEHIFTVDNLEYLYRGGRASRTSALVGGILNIKPVLHVDDGKLIPVEKVRGRGKALKRMVEIMGERGVDLKNQVVGISHGDDLEGVQKITELIKEVHGSTEFVVSTIGGAIGAHSGPGTLAVFFLNKTR